MSPKRKFSPLATSIFKPCLRYLMFSRMPLQVLEASLLGLNIWLLQWLWQYLALSTQYHNLSFSVMSRNPSFLRKALLACLIEWKPSPPASLGLVSCSQATWRTLLCSSLRPQRNLLDLRSISSHNERGGRAVYIALYGMVEMADWINVIHPTEERTLDLQPDNLLSNLSKIARKVWLSILSFIVGIPRYFPKSLVMAIWSSELTSSFYVLFCIFKEEDQGFLCAQFLTRGWAK